MTDARSNADQIGKVFAVRSCGLLECLVCGELFTRSTAPEHAESNTLMEPKSSTTSPCPDEAGQLAAQFRRPALGEILPDRPQRAAAAGRVVAIGGPIRIRHLELHIGNPAVGGAALQTLRARPPARRSLPVPGRGR